MRFWRSAAIVPCLVTALATTAPPQSVLAQRDDPQHVAPTDPLPPSEQLKQFRLPPGFEIQLVAAEPDVRKPINMSFDARGRLYVTQSVEYPFPAKDPSKARDRVSVLEDFAADGRARKVSVFIDGLNIPIGVTPTADGAIVYSIPNLYRCRDTDGDGKIDSREAIYREFGHGDTHGMVNSLTRWIDGWVYACHGFSNTSTVKGADGKPITMQSGNTFRFREDGSHVEYFTHGQVNPFGLAFDPLGNLFSTDCHSLPAYQLIRGAWYPSFGKPHDGLGYGPTIMSHQHGSTGLAGIVYYAADHFPADYQDTLFIGNPVTRRINHDKLETHGSTYRAIEQPDFVICDDPWFRPVHMQLGPDGAIYVADFYNRIIGHYEVPLTHPLRDRERGRIWRIVYRGKDGKHPLPKMPGDITPASLDRLIELLGHPNLTVRTLATNELVDRSDHSHGREIVERVSRLFEREAAGRDGRRKPMSTPEQRAFGLWIVERCSGLSNRQVATLAADKSALVRVHLMKAFATRRPSLDVEYDLAPFRNGLSDENAFVRRAAAEALGQHRQDLDMLWPALLKLWADTPPEDTHLIHTVRIVLRDSLLGHRDYEVLPPTLTRSNANYARLAEVSLGVHTSESARFVLGFLKTQSLKNAPREEYLHHAARHIDYDHLEDVYTFASSLQKTPWDQQRIVLRAVQRALQERGMALPEGLRTWALGLTRELLTATDEGKARAGLEFAKELNVREAADALAPLADRASRFAGLRVMAVESLAAVDAGGSIARFDTIVGDGADGLEVRRKAATALAGVDSAKAREALLKHLPSAPGALALEIAQGLSRTREGCLGLLTAAEQGKVPASLLQDRVVLDGVNRSQIDGAAARLAKLTAGLPSPDDRLRQLVEHRRQEYQRVNADAVKGQAVFKKICAACHKIGGEGNKIGPELDGIGLRGFDRILEDTLDPSRTVDQAFRATQVLTKDGRTIVGLKLRTEGEVLIMANNEGKEVRIPTAEIDKQGETKLSPMPANLADTLPPEEFYHLVKFLLSQRQPPAEAKTKAP